MTYFYPIELQVKIVKDLHKNNDLLIILEMRFNTILKRFKALCFFLGIHTLILKDKSFTRVEL
jgi:hypothetical protein